MYQYQTAAPDMADIEATEGLVLLNFGTDWCGHCQAAQTSIIEFLKQHPHLKHITVEDGKGRKLGRQFQVKLWPSVILLNNGVELARVIRPTTLADLAPIESSLTTK